jgi:hypothetical protein
MDTNLPFALGILTGLVFVALVLLIKHKITEKPFFKYDERQQLARGKACQSALIVLIGYTFLNGLLSEAGWKWCDDFTSAVIGMFFTLLIFAIQCILTDAYLSLLEKPRTVVVLLVLVSIMEFAISFFIPNSHSYIMNQPANFNLICLSAGVVILIVLLVFIGKLFADKRARAE